MEEIDRLEVQVEAQAKQANAQLDSLVNKLNRVSASLSAVNSRGLAAMGAGVNKLTNAMNNMNSNAKTADFTRLAKNIGQLNGVESSKLHSVSSAISAIATAVNGLGGVSEGSLQIADMAKNIAKLGGVNVQRAITNLPQLEKALNSMLVSLSKAPQVSDSVIGMTAALANLASQGDRVGTAANAVSNSFDRQSGSAERTAKSTAFLSRTIGKLYQQYFLLIRAVGKVWKATEASMDFLETINYFEVSMRKIGDDASSQWKENGQANAEAYANSFSARLKQLTAKMSGYEVDREGNAKATGMKNLGMNPDEIMQWQAAYAQMADSLGVSEESALRFSKALTMLGADWASLRNLTFDQAWNKFASALAGQSRAVRSLGIDITNATLQEYAYRYGLGQAVSEMNQATKAQLRLLAILDQSKVAYGDLANTINSPSNQIRMLQQNFTNLARTIGNLFLPVVAKIVPYINAVTIALQRLFAWVGGLFGIKLESINSSMGGIDDSVADMVGGAEDFGDAIGKADKAAKKLKTTTLGIDELNINDPDKGSSGGGGGAGGIGGGNPVLDSAIFDALDEYEKKWQEAFDRMESKAQRLADKFSKMLEPVKEIIKDFMDGDFFKAGQDTSNLVAAIFEFFANAIDRVNWYKIGENIGDYFAGINWLKIFKSVAHLAFEAFKAGIELWMGMFSNAPIETTLITLGVLPKILKAITASNFVAGIKKLADKFKILDASVRGFMLNLEATGTPLTFGKAIEFIGSKMTSLQKATVGAGSVLAEFLLVKDGFYDLATGSDRVGESLLKIVSGAGLAAGALKLIGLSTPWTAAIVGITGVIGAISGVKRAADEIEAERIGESIKNALTNPGGTPISELSNSLVTQFNIIGSQFDSVSEKAKELDGIKTSMDSSREAIDTFVFAMQNGATATSEDVDKIVEKFGQLTQDSSEMFQKEAEIIYAGLAGSLGEAVIAAGGSVEEYVRITSNLQTELQKAMQEAKKGVEDLRKQYDAGSISEAEFTEGIVKLYTEMNNLTGRGQEAKRATEDFKNLVSGEQIDWTEFWNEEENKLDTKALEEHFANVGNAARDAKTTIEENGAQYTEALKDMINLAELEGDTEGANAFKELLKTHTDSIAEQTKEIDRLAGEYTRTIQDNLVNKIPEMVEGVKEPDWNAKLLGKTKEGDVRKAVDQFNQDYIIPITNSIQTEFDGLGEAGKTYASDAMGNIMAGLFEYSTYEGANGMQLLETNLTTDVEGAVKRGLDAAKEGTIIHSKTFGKDTLGGYNKGISENVDATHKTINDWMDGNVRAIHDSAMKFGSPSKTAIDFGKDTVVGFNQGIDENVDSSVRSVESWLSEVSETMLGELRSLERKVKSICESIISSINSAMSAATSVGDVSINVKALGIGGYAAGGFPDTGELFFARENGITEYVGSMGGRSAVANNDQIVAGITAGVRAGINAEEIISALKAMTELLHDISVKDPEIVFDTREGLKSLKERAERNGFVFEQ